LTETQQWHPQSYQADAAYVSKLGVPVVELLAPQAGERILDLGCGDGSLTVELLASGAEVVGIDASEEMVGAALQRGVDAHVVDARALEFDAEFDAVFSNAVLHWIKQADTVLAGVERALRIGGRVVGEMGGLGNVAQIVTALTRARRQRNLNVPNPWFFPAADDYAALLEQRGLEVQSIELFPRPTPLRGDVGTWIEVFAQAFLADFQELERSDFIADVVEDLRAPLCNEQGEWHADYVRLRFCAIKAAS